MVDANWDYMDHGVYNSRPVYGYSIEPERESLREIVSSVKQHTGKTIKGMLAGGVGYTENTDDLLAEAADLHDQINGEVLTERHDRVADRCRDESLKARGHLVGSRRQRGESVIALAVADRGADPDHRWTACFDGHAGKNGSR